MFGLRALKDDRVKKHREMRRASEKRWFRIERKTILGRKILWILAEDELPGDVILNERDYRPVRVRQGHRPVDAAPVMLESQS